MSAQGRGYTYSYREALTILGNGDSAKGRKLIDELAGRLVHARTEHPASQWAGVGEKFAHNAIASEVGEVWDAMRWETPERVKSELLDVLATSVRAHNDEHK